MSSNETLAAATPIIDANDMQAASTPMAEEQAYTYQRADGTVERARNAEDAIARCPVLGKLAIEAPDQASVLLELAVTGNAKMAAEAKEKPKKPTHQAKLFEPKSAKAAEAENKIPESSPKQLTRTGLPTIVKEPNEEKQPVIKVDSITNYHAEYERVEKQQREESQHVIDNAVEPNAGVVVAVSEKPKTETQKEHTVRLELPVLDKEEPDRLLTANNNESIDSAPIVSSEIEQRDRVVMDSQEIDSEHKSLTSAEHTASPQDVDVDIAEVFSPTTYNEEAIINEADEPTVMTDELANTLDVEYEISDTETALEVDDIEAPDFTLSMDSETSTELISHEIATDPNENIKLLFEPETAETYFEIRDLIVDSETSEAVSTETTEPEVAVLNESETVTESEPVDIPTFEAFINTQPIIQDVKLESIKEQASEQPLEQTLVQLAECLAKSTEDDEHPESLMVIIKDIEKALPSYYIGQEAEETKLQITPKMTDKLLALLRELCYQNPRGALVNLISKFGFEFLIQSLIYIFQLIHEDNRKEFLRISVSASSSDDNDSLSRLSKLLLKLVIGKEPLSEGATV